MSRSSRKAQEWTDVGFRQWSQDLFCAHKISIEDGRNEARRSRGKNISFGELQGRTIDRIARDIFAHPAKLDDVVSWWSTAASCFRSTADTSLFLETPQSRRLAVTEFASIQWQLHNSPLPGPSTYAEPTPQLTARVGHSLARLAKLSNGSSTKNKNIPGTIKRGHLHASESTTPAGNMRSSQPQDSNSCPNAQHCGAIPSAAPGTDTDVGNETVTPISIHHDRAAEACSPPVYTGALSVVQDSAITALNSTPAREIPFHNPADSSIGRPKKKKKRSATDRTKPKTNLDRSGECGARNKDVEARIKGDVESEREIVHSTLPAKSTKKRKRDNPTASSPGDVTNETSDALPERAAADAISLNSPAAISSASATAPRKRGGPKKMPISDSVVSSTPESNQLQTSKWRIEHSLSALQGAVPTSGCAPPYPSSEIPPPKKRRKSELKQGAPLDGSTNPSGRAARSSNALPLATGTTTPPPVTLAPAMPLARHGMPDIREGVRPSPGPPLTYPGSVAGTGMKLADLIGPEDAFHMPRKSSRAAARDAHKRIAGHIELRQLYEQEWMQAPIGPPFSPRAPPPPPPQEQSTPMDRPTSAMRDGNFLTRIALESRGNDLIPMSDAPTRVQRPAPSSLPSPPATIVELDSPHQSPEQRTSKVTTPLRPIWTPPTPPYSVSQSNAGAPNIIRPRPYFVKGPPFQARNTEIGAHRYYPTRRIIPSSPEDLPYSSSSRTTSSTAYGKTDPFVIRDVPLSSTVSRMGNMPITFPKQHPRLERRPLVHGFPDIWAETRAEICETLQYFRTYQAGVNVENQIATGYLLDGFPGSRDYCSPDARVIISHGGGGSGVGILPDGRKVSGMNADHKLDKGSPAALWNAFTKKQAVVLLAGSRYQGFPFQFEEKCRYFVLGWYAITHAWCYPEGNVLPGAHDSALRKPGQATRSMFRFQWLPDAPGSTPWWYRFNPQPHFGADKIYKDTNCVPWLSHNCETCHGNSPIIFEEGRCLEPDCPSFVKGNFIGLQYHPSLLVETRIKGRYKRIYQELAPSLAWNILFPSEPKLSTAKEAWSGWYCKGCGKITSRTFWDRWHCSQCGSMAKQFLASHPIRPPPDGGGCDRKIKLHNLLSFTEYVLDGLHVRVHVLPERSFIFHIRGLDISVVNAIFADYQDRDAQRLFQRRSTHANFVGGTKNRHFSFNSGVPYKYSSRNDTISFEDGPRCVRSAREAITNVVRRVLGLPADQFDFNELLSVAYMEDMSMGYHSDDEPGLQNVVASLSMGTTCNMQFRTRQKPAKGFVFENPGAFQALGPHSILTLQLGHGDVVIMAGNVQSLYEHRIQRVAGLRIAATCRIIDQYIHNHPPT